MEIITKFLVAMQLLLLAKVAILLVLGIGAAIVGYRMRKRWLIIVGLIVAFGQFVVPWLSNGGYEHQIAARRRFVNDLPRTPVAADYPRRLVVEGDLSPNPPGWFIAAAYVDELDIGGRRLVATGDAALCRAAAMAIFDPDRPRERAKFAGNPYDQIRLCTRVAGLSSPDSDALILRVDHEATLYDRENARRHGAPRAIQLSVRRRGKEVLAHYDEMPILAYPASATQLLPEGYGYPCGGFAYLQIVANLLDAAREPGRATAVMQRGADRRSPYDPCIASIAPRLKGAGR